ncbi:MAG: MFS transporter, partial [Caldilineaceae bacterium]|nr:MFS transporter [Caldilineaceae bacterium]
MKTSVQSAPQRARAWNTLAIPDFRRLAFSNFLWWQANLMEQVVLGWLVLELTDSAWLVALAGFARSAPYLISGFISGLVIDRFGRRKIILAAQACNTAVYGIIAGLLWVDQLTFWHLLVGALISGAAWSLDWPARRSLVPDLVGKERTIDAMIIENFVQNFSRILGPFTGGTLIAILGARGCYTVLTLLSALTLIVLTGLAHRPLPQTALPTRRSPFATAREGLRYVRSNEPILAVLLITALMNMLAFPYMTLLPVFARDVLNQGPIGLGILGAGNGIGAFVGLLIINQLRHRINPGWIFGIGSCFQAIALLGFANSSILGLSLLLLIASGLGQACFSTMQSSIILLSSSDEMRSRAMGTLVLAIGAGPLGRLQVGALAETLGAPLAVTLQTILAAVLVGTVILKLPGLRRA